MNIPTFTPHKVTEQELEICKQIQEAQHLYCRERDCKDCPYFGIGDGLDGLNDLSCKILYTYQFCKEQRKMKEQIIYFDTLRDCYCVTSRENYEARITNARAVMQCSDFASAEQVRDYLVNHGYGTKDQYTIIPQEEEQ